MEQIYNVMEMNKIFWNASLMLIQMNAKKIIVLALFVNKVIYYLKKYYILQINKINIIKFNF